MADQAPPADVPASEKLRLRTRIGRRLSGMVTWATATKLRLILTGIAGLVTLGGVFALWSYVGHLAVDTIDPADLERALAKLDEGKFDEAKAIISEMHHQRAEPEMLGAAMYVLGAVRANDAAREKLAERARDMHQVAARYLQKARSLGIPGERQSQAALLLGRSLLRAGQSREAVPVLEEALHGESAPAGEIHLLIVKGLLEGPDPKLEQALEHAKQALTNESLSQADRQRALLAQAETLLRLNRPADAEAALSQLPADGEHAAERNLVDGRIKVEHVQRMASDAPQRKEHLTAALDRFREVQRLDANRTSLARHASFWIAKCHELAGDDQAALAEYDRLSKLFGDTPEGLFATLAEADYARRQGQIERALDGYQSALQAIGDPLEFENQFVSFAELRQRMTAAYQQFIRDEMFDKSLALADMFEPVVGAASCLDLRAKTHARWGERRLEQARDERGEEADAFRKEGLLHLRAAGRAYEDLARVRFASREFTSDLWTAGDFYFRGQSYTNAARVLQEYLHHEAQRWNSIALLRLGQSFLATNRSKEAIQVLEECIEMFPNDSLTYQTRLETARAYQQAGKFTKAEELLLSNLNGEGLTPASAEWRDSLFALGGLLYDAERYEEAVARLQEAVDRYPESGGALLAKYTIGRAYHSASEVPARRLRESKTENERQVSRAQMMEFLDKAYETYQDVQRTITLEGQLNSTPLELALQRNCYMMQGSALFEMRRFEEAAEAYGRVITLYQNEPIVLESFVQLANCWRRLEQPVRARVALDQAKMVLERLPKDANFLASTNFNRQQWQQLLEEMGQW